MELSLSKAAFHGRANHHTALKRGMAPLVSGAPCWSCTLTVGGPAAEGRQLRGVEWGWTVLSGTGGPCDTALCLHDAQPCSHLTISTGTFGLHQACAALPVSSGPWAVGAARWPSLLFPLLLLYKLPLGVVAYWCVGCSPAAERNPPCRMNVDKSAPGEIE